MAGPKGDGFAVYGNERGLFIGPDIPFFATSRNRDGGPTFAPRPRAELEAWLGLAYGGRVDLTDRMPILERAAQAYNRGALVQALIVAARLRLPPLDEAGLHRLAKAGLTRFNFNPLEPRDRRGRWTYGGDAGVQPAADEEEDPEASLDPLAPLRQAQWDAGIALLRRLDPHDPSLTYVSVPGAAPDEAALARLQTAIRDAAIRRIRNRVMPGGQMIGTPGTKPDIRELPGGLDAAKDLFDYLRLGSTARAIKLDGIVVKLPAEAGYITFRPVSGSDDPAIDINLPNAKFKIHFPDRK